MPCSGVLFCSTYSRKQAHTPVGIIISHLESISRASGRFPGGIRYELSHDFKRNPIFQFMSANKGYFAVLWEKQIPTETSYLDQTTRKSNCNRPLPTHQFLLKTFSHVRKIEKSRFF